MKVDKDTVVTMTYKLSLEDGELVEEADADEPIIYLHGHQNLVPGLENELTGLNVGDSKTVTVTPDDGYGDRDESNILEVPRSEMPDHIPFEPGLVLSISSADDDESIATVVEVDDETIVLDFNHPMAGETLTFEVEILDIREANEEEIAHGHAHGDHNHH